MALSEAYNILCYISLVSVLIPILLFVLKIKAPNKSLRALFIYLFIYLVTDLIGFILMLQDKSTTILFNIFTIIEFELICYIFHSEINNFKAKKFIQAIGVLFLIFALSFFGRHFDEGGDLVSSVEALLVVVFSSKSTCCN